ncbi:MAG: amidohydrolase [Sphingomonadales bacterium]|nr:MAG: amidohydrolase [Sphingomonadales bacterium]
MLSAWLASAKAEEIIDPNLPIVDPHHHLWNRGGHTYRRTQLLKDLAAGHHATRTIYVECRSRYAEDAPLAFQPVGETCFVVSESASAEIGDRTVQPCAGIVAHADLTLGAELEAVLDAHAAAAQSRLRGIRYSVAWDASPAIHAAYPTSPSLLARNDVRAGLRLLARRSLAFDAWLYFHQLGDLCDMADAVPDLQIVLDHCGGPIGIGPYAGRRAEVFDQRRKHITELARRPNVAVKVGGLGMALSGFGFRKHARPPSSTELAAAWLPYAETIIDLFGADRAMFESNYPVDMSSGTYATIWNAFKRLAADASTAERTALFSETATRVYQL